MATVDFVDLAPGAQTFLEDVLSGLSQRPKTLPCKYFYDERGSRLFDEICELEEYYPTRTETAILRDDGAEMADWIGPEALVIEYGSGSSVKTPLLLEPLHRPAGYVPVDISKEHLRGAAARLAAKLPRLTVLPVCADFTQPFALPRRASATARRVAFFPGSTIGNFQPEGVVTLLQQMADLVGPGGGLIVGVDLEKDRRVLEQAYNDRRGVTRDFNLNVLRRIQTELGGRLNLADFQHQAIYNEAEGRIEMHLVSRVFQSIALGGEAFSFEPGESIVTEYSHKYTLEKFARLACEAGWRVDRIWTDSRRWFSVQALTRVDA